MVHVNGLTSAQRVIQLLEGVSTFMINVRASDEDSALEKIINNRKAYKGSELLLQKENVLHFYDKLKRPLAQMIDVVQSIIDRVPQIKDPNGTCAGVIELTPGNFLFFGVGKT